MPIEAFDGVLFVVTDVLVDDVLIIAVAVAVVDAAAVADVVLVDAPDDDVNTSTDDGTKRMPSAVARMVANNSIKRCCR